MHRQTVEPKIKKSLTKLIEEYLSVDVENKTRKQEYINARMIYYKLLTECRYSYTAIARSLNKNHATIMHGLNLFEDLFDIDNELREYYYLIRQLFFDERSNSPHKFSTRQELLVSINDLENQNKSLNLLVERLKDSLKSYQKYDYLYDIIEERNLNEEKLNKFKRKLNSVLNGV